MDRRIFKIITTGILLFCMTSICFAEVSITAVYPPDGGYADSINFLYKWDNSDKENEYYYQVNMWSDPPLEPVPEIYPYAIRGVTNYWKVGYCLMKYYPCPSIEFSQVYSFRVREKEDIPEEIEEEPEIVKEEEEVTQIPEETAKEEEGIVNTPAPVVAKPIVEEKKYSDTIDWSISTEDVKGVSDEAVCKMKYVKGEKKATMVNCNISPVTITKAVESGSEIYIEGIYSKTVYIQLDIYTCNKDIKQLSSFFKCSEVFSETKDLYLDPKWYFEISGLTTKYFSNDRNTFKVIFTGDLKSISQRLKYTYTILYKTYGIDFSGGGQVKFQATKQVSDSNKPFSFPFSKYIGVTQWHGYTAYAKPHTGIDFGAVNENVLSVGDGEVIAKGWDSFNGECFSGGNYLVIKQSNGMYTAYFHLKQVYVDTGKKVKKGDVVALSGNTGSWNCQALGYHLHFEARTSRSQSTHVDPVRYLAVDWNKIVTLNSKSISGRLSGDNPHPSF